MNFVETICVDVEKPKEGDRNKYTFNIDFSKIGWYAETEDLFQGEATNFIKFGIHNFLFLTIMPIIEFKKHLHE